MLESLTFLLAVIGYAGLTTTAVFAAAGRPSQWLWRLTAAVIVAHVALVWTVRYGWRLDAATQNGYAVFVVFHGALALILVSLVTPARLARQLVWLAWGIVTLGAVGAVFSDPAVSIYRIPIILLALGGAAKLIAAWRRQRLVAG